MVPPCTSAISPQPPWTQASGTVSTYVRPLHGMSVVCPADVSCTHPVGVGSTGSGPAVRSSPPHADKTEHTHATTERHDILSRIDERKHDKVGCDMAVDPTRALHGCGGCD